MRALSLVSKLAFALCLSASFVVPGCASDDAAPTDPATNGDDYSNDEQPFTSDQAILLDFEFDGELQVDNVWSAEQAVQDQLLYTIGHLNENTAVGRLDKLKLTNVTRSAGPGNSTIIKYHAVLPVGWGKKTGYPTSYTFKLPKDISGSALKSFTEKYKHDCVEYGAHDVDEGSMWYYYRPGQCTLAQEDILAFEAKVTVSAENRTGIYPEYDRVWDDNQLRVVAIFGKYEDGKTENSDAGISAYNRFLGAAQTDFGVKLVSDPPNVGTQAGVKNPDVKLDGTLADGRSIHIRALLVDNIASAGPDFDARYAEESADADVLIYSGHAGLGQNVRALARKGEFKAGKYQIMFMNGCDTFAYVDGSMAQSRARLNPDDPTGTKYLDILTNVMPSMFSSMPRAATTLLKGLTTPTKYEDIFKNIDRSQVILVTGEEDNLYTPEGPKPDPAPEAWKGLTEAATVASGESVSYETPELPVGKYLAQTTEDAENPGGDVDLYVAIGRAPTLEDYDYRPYRDGSSESVPFELKTPGKVYVMVHGYEGVKTASPFFLSVRPTKLPRSRLGLFARTGTGSLLAYKSTRRRGPAPVLTKIPASAGLARRGRGLLGLCKTLDRFRRDGGLGPGVQQEAASRPA
jgi:hypothetical protein